MENIIPFPQVTKNIENIIFIQNKSVISGPDHNVQSYIVQDHSYRLWLHYQMETGKEVSVTIQDNESP